MMDEFVQHVGKILEIEDVSSLSAESRLESFANWDSLAVISLLLW